MCRDLNFSTFVRGGSGWCLSSALETEPNSGCCPQCLAEWLYSTRQIISHESFFQIYMSIIDRARGQNLSLKGFFFLVTKTHEVRLTKQLMKSCLIQQKIFIKRKYSKITRFHLNIFRIKSLEK